MKKIFFIFSVMFFCVAAAAQNEIPTADTTQPKILLPGTNIYKNLYVDEVDIAYPNKLISDYTPNFLKQTNIKYQAFELPKYDYRLEQFMTLTRPNPLAVRNPYSYDYRHTGFMRVTSNSYLNTYQSRNNYLLIGLHETVGAQYTYNISDRFKVSAGAGIEKYRTDAQSRFDVNLNAQAVYLLSDRVSVTGFVQHSFDKNKSVRSQGMFSSHPQIYYGGFVTYGITDRLYVRGGAYGTNYAIQNLRHNDYGFNGEIGYWLTDRVKIAGFGQYSARNNKGALSQGYMGMYPQSYYGGYLEFKVTDSWGVRAGAKQEFDWRKNKWVTVPYFEVVGY